MNVLIYFFKVERFLTSSVFVISLLLIKETIEPKGLATLWPFNCFPERFNINLYVLSLGIMNRQKGPIKEFLKGADEQSIRLDSIDDL